MERNVLRIICLLGLACVAVLHLSEIWLAGHTSLAVFLTEWLPLYVAWLAAFAVSRKPPGQGNGCH
ncbi:MULTISPECIES: hypothetical protein [Photobacterium]|uniref:Uncharacterized protein n=1 Tax=Photobacterium halotolerans TaxID=265726 RepID=A0A0F5VAX3_9GAMM|nr:MULTISPECIES: hypothetical protein [Photobacterium]KKC98931.1 hypothetical protein KY46_15100 [Photobacterium halotolerans]UIP28665.1 hypothetical protein LN341_04065 [Photobacterium sp. TLY01]